MKKFKHKEIEICKISKKKINTKKDRYAIILDCNGDKIESIGFYKSEVLKDLIQGKGQLVANKVTDNVYNMASSILERAGIIKPTFEVK